MQEQARTYYLISKANSQVGDVTREVLLELSKTNKIVCKKCGTIQGEPANGFNQYYCSHITNKIDQKLKNKKEAAFKQLIQSHKVSMSKKKLG